MKRFMHDLMTDRLKGRVYTALKAMLYILSLAYGFAIYFRRVFYRLKIFKSQKPPLRVISVGNLTLGGTGKTPFTICLARLLKDDMKKEVAVLTRGYGWDEQAMLKKDMPDIPVLVGENRARSCHRAIKLYGTDTAVLDDGFQHWELERDLDILLVDSRNPFGNGCLLPRGILREPIDAARRADIIVFTKIDKKKTGLDELINSLSRIKNDIIYAQAGHVPKCIYDVRSRQKQEPSYLRGKRVMLLSSIGDPEYFEQTVRELEADVVEHIIFVDHHNYVEKDRRYIMNRCEERSFDFILTTEKDAVKLDRMKIAFTPYALMTLNIELEITAGKEKLVARLHSLYNS